MRGRDRRCAAGAWPEDADDLVAMWHTHELHQLLYAFEGVAEVETDGSRHLLPPQQAAWIPAGLARTRRRCARCGTVAVFFEPSMVPGTTTAVRVLSAAAPVREMIVYAARWRIDRPVSDPTADAFFTALALLTAEWLDTAETPLRLPTSAVPVVAAVMRHTQEHLADVDERAVCAAVGISERSLRRQFRAETGTSLADYRTTSRVLRAMAMLASTTAPSSTRVRGRLREPQRLRPGVPPADRRTPERLPPPHAGLSCRPRPPRRQHERGMRGEARGRCSPSVCSASSCRYRGATGPIAVAERVLAVQAQDLHGSLLAVRARSTGLTRTDVEDSVGRRDRSLVVTWLNRGTLHLVLQAEDYPWLHPLTAPRPARRQRPPARAGESGSWAPPHPRGGGPSWTRSGARGP